MSLPCFYGTVYTGPNVGLVTQTNLPTVILTNTVPTNYAVSMIGNGTSFTGSQGCTIQYLRFSGTRAASWCTIRVRNRYPGERVR